MTSTSSSLDCPVVVENEPVSIENRTDFADIDVAYSALRDSVVSQNSISSCFTFNASWRPDSLNQPSFLGTRSRQLTDGSGSGDSGSRGTPESQRSQSDFAISHGPLDVHYEDVEDDRLSDASTLGTGNPFSDSIAEYLAGYGYPEGLGYDRPPDDLFDWDDDGSQQYAYIYSQSKLHRSPFYSPSPTAFDHEFAPSNFPKSVECDSSFSRKSMLDSLFCMMGLDKRLRDDPLGVWEDMCWDAAAPETPVDLSDPSSWDTRADETHQRGVGADHRGDCYYARDRGLAQLGVMSGNGHGGQGAADVGASSPQTPSTATARARPANPIVQETDTSQRDSEVFDISPTALTGASAVQSPIDTIVTETPTSEFVAEAGARAQGRRTNRVLAASRPGDPQPHDARPLSAASNLGDYASYAQAMVRQRQAIPATTPPLRLSMVVRESVPMYGERDQDRLIVSDQPPNDPPPYEARSTSNGEISNSSANVHPEAVPIPPTPPSSSPAPQARSETHGRDPSPDSRESGHTSVYSTRAVVGAKSKASVPMPMPPLNQFPVTNPSSSIERTINPSPASRTASPSAHMAQSQRHQTQSPSPTDSDALRTPTGPWSLLTHASVNPSGLYGTPNGPAVMNPNYATNFSQPASARDSVAYSPTRSDTTARRSRPLPTAPAGTLSPGVTRVVPASWVSTSIPARLSSGPRMLGTNMNDAILPVTVSFEAEQDILGRPSGSSSDDSGSIRERKSKYGIGNDREYGISKESLSLASPTSTVSPRTPTKFSPLRRLDEKEQPQGKEREKALRLMNLDVSMSGATGGGGGGSVINVGKGMKRLVSRCGTISRKIVNGGTAR